MEAELLAMKIALFILTVCFGAFLYVKGHSENDQGKSLLGIGLLFTSAGVIAGMLYHFAPNTEVLLSAWRAAMLPATFALLLTGIRFVTHPKTNVYKVSSLLGMVMVFTAATITPLFFPVSGFWQTVTYVFGILAILVFTYLYAQTWNKRLLTFTIGVVAVMVSTSVLGLVDEVLMVGGQIVGWLVIIYPFVEDFW